MAVQRIPPIFCGKKENWKVEKLYTSIDLLELQESTETLIHSIISELNYTITCSPHLDGNEATLLFTMFVKSIESHGLLTDFITPTRLSPTNEK